MNTTTAPVAGENLILSTLVSGLRNWFSPAAPRARPAAVIFSAPVAVAAPAAARTDAGAPDIMALYRMAGAGDSVRPAVGVALASRYHN